MNALPRKVLPYPVLHYIQAVGVGSEMLADVPDLVSVAAADLKRAVARQVDHVMHPQCPAAGVGREGLGIVLGRVRDERVLRVLGVELLEQLNVISRFRDTSV